MAVASYPTPLDATSTNIDLVGGKDAFIGMQREDKNGNRYVLYMVKSGGTISDGTWLSAEFNSGLESPLNFTIPVVGANTTGKTLTELQYFWCMVYGTYDMSVSISVDYPYRRLSVASGGTGQKIADNDEIGPRHSCGMSLEGVGARVAGKARCLIDPRSGYLAI